MKNILTLTKREWLAYFYSPLAYVVMTAFVFVFGLLFYLNLNWYKNVDAIRSIIGALVGFTALIIAPLLTMRLLAEEKKQGTLEILMTAPITELEIVVSKFLAVFSFYIFLLLPTITYSIILILWGNPDLGAIIAGYLGLILMSGVFLAIGLFMSSLTSNQLIASILTFAIIAGLWFADGLASSLSGRLSEVVSYISIYTHFIAFSKGLIDSRDVIYCLSIIVFWLFLTVRVLESKRWR